MRHHLTLALGCALLSIGAGACSSTGTGATGTGGGGAGTCPTNGVVPPDLRDVERAGEGSSTPPSAPPRRAPRIGSRFRLKDGQALLGPATNPLPAFAMSFDGDDALVDTTQTVDAARRI